LILSRGFFFQKLLEGLSEDTLGVSRPTAFLPAMTRLFSSVLSYLMKLTEQTGFDNHGYLRRLLKVYRVTGDIIFYRYLNEP
jgi:hypothetical protein